MAVKFTKAQQSVIDVRGKNILVAAAAGSGKTAVLVERILQLITDPQRPVDVDRILVVTFTKAAAAQMRERIYDAIEIRLSECPTDENLIRQSTLIHTAMIMTIDSFCVFLLRNHFHEIGLDPAFRIGDESELSMLRAQVMEALMDEAYESEDASVRDCVAFFNRKVLDELLEDVIIKVYNFAQSSPWPMKWLSACEESYVPQTAQELEQTTWAQDFLALARQYLQEGKNRIEKGLFLCGEPGGPKAYLQNLTSDKEIVDSLLLCETYETLYDALQQVSFSRLSTKKEEADPDLKQEVKVLRDSAKACITACRDMICMHTLTKEFGYLSESRSVFQGLLMLTRQFSERYLEEKLNKNIIDFSDEVHMALSILVNPDGSATNVAKAYQAYFSEIMIDEYQDSNLVQELLLSRIAMQSETSGNRFMVGDIKQSIYRFRLANPELFLEKYNTYPTDYTSKDIRINLNQNFRSRKEVIDTVNCIFEKIMTKSVGGVVYDDDAKLYLGADYPEGKDGEFDTEYLLYERSEKDDLIQAEAEMIAGKIDALMRECRVTGEDGTLRAARYSDIVILLRSTKEVEAVWKRIFLAHGIPMKTESRTGYFDTDEIQSVISFLKVIENPFDDIALVGTMKSVFGGMNDEDLARLKLLSKDGKWMERLHMSEEIHHKAFCEKIAHYQALSDYMGIYELLTVIFEDFKYQEYVSALPGGAQKRANVEMLLAKALSFEKTTYHGLYSFVNYIKQLHKYEVEMGQADVSGEANDAVTLMTIHKSKGLEFPIVFVSRLHKQFNMADQKNVLSLDMTYGIAMDFANRKKHTKAKSLRKQAFIAKEKLAMLGEELRIFYVALTRAKEKLILTGCIKDFEKKMEGLCVYQDDILPFSKLIGCRSYLELLLPAMCKRQELFRIVHKEALQKEIVAKEFTRQVKKELLEDVMKKQTLSPLAKEILLQFEQAYPHECLKNLYAKTSVSELKKAHMQDEVETQVIFETDRIEQPYLPSFVQETERAGGAMRGSAYHRLLELIAYETLFSQCYFEKPQYETPAKDTIKAFTKAEFERIREGGKMQEDIALVSVQKIEAFLASECAYRMARAAAKGWLFREQPFVMAIEAGRVNPEVPEDEKVLIQGIIDVFFYEEMPDGAQKICLLDYKTDRVEHPEELIRRYQVQLDYYEEALQKLTKKPVWQKMIYSFAFDTQIEV